MEDKNSWCGIPFQSLLVKVDSSSLRETKRQSLLDRFYCLCLHYLPLYFTVQVYNYSNRVSLIKTVEDLIL